MSDECFEGTLDWNQFLRSVDQLSAVSAKVDDNWIRREVSTDVGGVYMTKTEFKALPVVDKVSNVESLDTTDPQEVNTSTETIAKFEYHIVYSISYSVPVLYFTVTKTDGSLVRIEDIWKWIPKSIHTSEQTSDASDVDMTDESALYRKYGSMLTQMEHPLLMRPFYAIHPCHTSTFMNNIFSGKQCHQNKLHINKEDYLISWLSTIAPIAALRMKPEYGIQTND